MILVYDVTHMLVPAQIFPDGRYLDFDSIFQGIQTSGYIKGALMDTWPMPVTNHDRKYLIPST
jgi:hypothetical protein